MDDIVQEAIVHVLQNTATENEMRIFTEWFYSYEENKSLYFQLKQIYDLRKGGLYPNNEELEASWNRLWAKVKKNQSQSELSVRKIHKTNIRHIILAATAIGLLILCITWFYLQKGQSVSWVEIRTASHSHPQNIIMPDGSTALLNASSLLKYPKKFTGKTRQVYLDGEALFDIVKNGKPFEVISDKQQIIVLGTQFNVMDYSVDPYFVTTLVKGKIELKTYNDSKKINNDVILKPNQQIEMDKKTNYITLREVNPDAIISWTTGIYSFENMPLEQITSRLEKMYHVTFIIPDKNSRKEKYTGKFSSEQSIEEIIKIINFKRQFDCHFQNDTIVLQRE